MKVAVLGSGSSGLTAAKSLLEEGLEFTVFEATDAIGGLWHYRKESGGPSYPSLIANTSKQTTAFSDFPFADDVSEFPSSLEMVEYLNRYCDHFQLRRHISFNTSVEAAVLKEGKYFLTVRRGGRSETLEFDDLIVCSGMYSNPHLPVYPGTEKYTGQIFHSHSYQGPEEFRGKRVVVNGIGNSGGDIAVEIGSVASEVLICARNGAWVLPRYIMSRPLDHRSRISRLLPYGARNKLFRWMVIHSDGRMRDAGLSEPEFDCYRARITVNCELKKSVNEGRVRIRRGIERLVTDGVILEDGTYEQADCIMHCTGYRQDLSFLDKPLRPYGDKVKLYKNIFHPDYPRLAFIGVPAVWGGSPPIAEMQARVAARVLAGKIAPPPPTGIRHEMRKREALLDKRGSWNYSIVEYFEYLNELAGLLRARPRLWRYLYMAAPLLTGPVTASHFRLDGPGKWDGAATAIRKARVGQRAFFAHLLKALVKRFV